MPWVQIIMAVVQMAMSMKQASDQKKASAKAAQQKLDENAKAQWEQYEKNEKDRKDRLKKVLAQRRARMGAQGLSAADGSAGAIVQGLRTDAAEASHDDFTAKKEAIDGSISNIQSSLLEESKALNRKLYKQAGSSFGAIAGGMIGGNEQSADIGAEIGGAAGSMFD